MEKDLEIIKKSFEEFYVILKESITTKVEQEKYFSNIKEILEKIESELSTNCGIDEARYFKEAFKKDDIKAFKRVIIKDNFENNTDYENFDRVLYIATRAVYTLICLSEKIKEKEKEICIK